MTVAAAVGFLSGELDVSTAEETRRVTRLVLRGWPDVVVDVTAVTFVDCAGLAPLVELARDVRPAGGRVTLLGAGPAFRRLLRVTGLAELFDLPLTGLAPPPYV